MTHMLNFNASPDELESYVEEVVLETLRDGSIAPSALLECMYYALDPDALACVRAFTALPPAERRIVENYVKQLSDRRAD